MVEGWIHNLCRKPESQTSTLNTLYNFPIIHTVLIGVEYIMLISLVTQTDTVPCVEDISTVLLPYREQILTPKMPKRSLYGSSARIGNKNFLKSRKIRFYYIKGLKTPICTIVIVFFSLFVVSNHLKFQKLLDSKLKENFLKKV